MTWDLNTAQNGGANPVIIAKGRTYRREAGENVKDAVLEVAEEADLGKWDTKINGTTVEPADVNGEVLDEGDQVELVPYDRAG